MRENRDQSHITTDINKVTIILQNEYLYIKKKKNSVEDV